MRLFLHILLGVITYTGFVSAESVVGYGGATHLRSNATGWFRVAKIGARHLFVTPDGHGFFSLGVTHFRHFGDSPERKSLIASKYGSDSALSKRMVENLRSWSFNSAGYGVLPDMEQLIPFTAVIPTAGPMSYSQKESKHQDIFDPRWRSRAAEQVNQVCRRLRDNRQLIGYYYMDLPIWATEGGKNWVGFFRRLPPNAPGKMAYLKFLQEVASLEELASTYGVSADSWNALPSADFSKVNESKPEVQQHDLLFLQQLAEVYYRFYYETIRAADPEHLILGDRHPGWRTPNEIYAISSKYVDVISVQPVREIIFNAEKFDALHALTGLPILLCDQRTRAVPLQENSVDEEKSSGEAYHSFLLALAEKRYVVGKHRCAYIDDVPKEGYRRPGLLRDDDTPYSVLLEWTRKANQDALSLIYSQN